MNVYAAIAAATLDLSKEGIGKGRSNQQQGYKFRGIDDVLNALAPILAKHQLAIIPRVKSREVVERQTKSGSPLFYCTVAVDWEIVSAEDGTTTTATTYGEAMDSADKATNKAMSAAYKYMALLTFCIPTEGDNDADATTHEVTPRRATKDQPWESRYLDVENEFPGVPEGTRGRTSHFAREAGDDKLFKEIGAEIVRLESPAAVGAFIAGRKDAIAQMPAEWRATLRADLEEQKRTIAKLTAGETLEIAEGAAAH